MKSSTLAFFFILSFGSALGSKAFDARELFRHSRQAEATFGVQDLIQEMVSKLRDAATQAVDAIQDFIKGIRDMIPTFQNKLYSRIDEIRAKVNRVRSQVQDKIKFSGEAAVRCFEFHSSKVEEVFDTAVAKAMSCADERVKDMGILIADLVEATQRAAGGASDTLSQMKNCTSNASGISAATVCLGSLGFRTQVNTVVMFSQLAHKLAQINFGMSTFPGSLEMCTAVQLVEVGRSAAVFAAEIGRCSASTAFSVLSGSRSPAFGPSFAAEAVPTSASIPTSASAPTSAPAHIPTAPPIPPAFAPVAAFANDNAAN